VSDIATGAAGPTGAGPAAEAQLVPPAPRPGDPWFTRAELRVAALTIATLAALGALAGLAWSAWSDTATRGLVYTKTAIVPDQTEGFISSDGRFAVLTGVLGLLAGLIVWRLRAVRGPVAVAGLALGAVIGAALTDLVGHAVGGGTESGKVGVVLSRLPLEVHAIGLIFLEAMLALVVYVICAAFINPDDLGVDRRPPSVESSLGSPIGSSWSGPSVGPGLGLQQPGGDGHAPGPGHQDDLAPQ
jgi:hypothetical protein